MPDLGAEGLGEGGEGDVAVPAKVGAAFEVAQAEAVLKFAVVVLDGLITNGKFCCVGRVRLSLSWWHRPLRLRGSVLQSDVALAGESDDPDMDRLPPARPASRRRAPVGSGLPAVSALGRGGRPVRAGADRQGGA